MLADPRVEPTLQLVSRDRSCAIAGLVERNVGDRVFAAVGIGMTEKVEDELRVAMGLSVLEAGAC